MNKFRYKSFFFNHDKASIVKVISLQKKKKKIVIYKYTIIP